MKKLLKTFFTVNPVSITLGSIVLVIIPFLVGVPILDLIELKTFDLRFLSRGQVEPSPAVVMAVIDEKSLDREGRWPWPRSKIARLVDILSQDGAKVIGFDIGFLEPDENSNLSLIDQFGEIARALQINDERLFEFIRESKARADNDQALAEAIRNSSATIVLGYFLQTGKLGSVLERVSAYYDREVETSIKATTSMIEPIMIIIMGSIVGFIAMAIILPIFKMSQIVG